MPLPKRRFSRARTLKKRGHKKFKAAAVSFCPQCKQAKLPHRICLVCGYYDGRQVIEIKEKKEKKKK